MKRGKSALIAVFSLACMILLAFPSFASWNLDAESVVVNLSMSSGFDVEMPSGSELKYLTADVNFIPKEDVSQTILDISSDPAPHDKDSEGYVFKWSGDFSGHLDYSIDSTVKVFNTFHDIGLINFPYESFPASIAEYTQATKTIDSDDLSVIKKAKELASGETDYYALVFKFADWTRKNIEYDLSTLNIKASNSASWVLANRNGVCDELATLFIAMLRAVGIPARFVAGVAYTDSSEFPEPWGAHGWAEVYFPGHGWIPFDVTYGQFGHIDPTHVKLKEAFDPADSDVHYEWLGNGIDVSVDPIIVKANKISHTGKVPADVELSIRPIQKEVGVGSYNIIEVSVRNLRDSYTSVFLYLSRINELFVEQGNEMVVLLRPKENRKFYWIVKVQDGLDDRFTYTFPISVKDNLNNTAVSEFKVVPGKTVFSEDDLRPVTESYEDRSESRYDGIFELGCSQGKDFYYVYEQPAISCYVRNTGDILFNDWTVCFADVCEISDLPADSKVVFDRVVAHPVQGINKIPFRILGDGFAQSFFFDVDMLDVPDVEIMDITYPEEIRFGVPFTVSFVIKKSSISLPEDVSFMFDAAGRTKEFDVDDLDSDQEYVLHFDSGSLSVKPNVFDINVTFSDLNGKNYSTSASFNIHLVDVTIGQRVVIFLHDIGIAIADFAVQSFTSIGR